MSINFNPIPGSSLPQSYDEEIIFNFPNVNPETQEKQLLQPDIDMNTVETKLPIMMDQTIPEAQQNDEQNVVKPAPPRPASKTAPQPSISSELNHVQIHQINTLAHFFKKKIVEMMILDGYTDIWNEKFKSKLRVHLELTKVILKPPHVLQFLRHFAKEVLSEKSSFTWNFDTIPAQLPLPISQSWIPMQPYTVHIPNPMLRALFQGILIANEYQLDYIKCLTTFVNVFMHMNAAQTIRFQQLHICYEFNLPFSALSVLFFPQFAALLAQSEEKNIMDRFTSLVFSPYHFSMRDLRLSTTLEGHTSIFESLISSNAIGSFPLKLLQSPIFKSHTLNYLTFLLCYGATQTESILPQNILHTIFTLISQVFEEEPIINYPSEFYYYLHAACQNPIVEQIALQFPHIKSNWPLPPPFEGKPSLNYKPEESFLIRNLRSSWSNNVPSRSHVVFTNDPPFLEEFLNLDDYAGKVPADSK